MADPAAYIVSFDFSAYQASNPSDPLPGVDLDVELANIATAISGSVDAIKDVRRSDGALKNGIVTLNSLDTAIKAILGASDDLTVVAANMTSIVAVGNDIANVNTVAGIAANVTTVAGIAANVTTVAANEADINTVVANLADIQNAAENAALAKDWASKAAGVVVSGGLFSALSYAADAAASAASIDPTTLVKNTAQALTATQKAQARANIGLDTLGVFIKSDPYSVAFTKTGAGTISIKAGTIVEVAGSLFTFGALTAVSMPALIAGTDYAIWIKPDGTLEATTDFVSAPVVDSRKIGGFHYAPGGNATGTAGGDTTPAINEYSIWDLKFRPACSDPRGMALVAGSFWADIYLCGVNHHTDGTSKYNVTIADGSSPPKIPAAFGGNGSTAYSTLNWWEAAEVMASHGKELLDYAEFATAAYGTTENSSGGTDPVSTILRAAYTSKWGLMLATGNLYVWGREFSYRQDGVATPWAWRNLNGGRGQLYLYNDLGLVAALFGGDWGSAANSGSRASNWANYPWDSGSSGGARGRSDHLNHV